MRAFIVDFDEVLGFFWSFCLFACFVGEFFVYLGFGLFFFLKRGKTKSHVVKEQRQEE